MKFLNLSVSFVLLLLFSVRATNVYDEYDEKHNKLESYMMRFVSTNENEKCFNGQHTKEITQGLKNKNENPYRRPIVGLDDLRSYFIRKNMTNPGITEDKEKEGKKQKKTVKDLPLQSVETITETFDPGFEEVD